ncbi:unnamed protein product [Kluyveromyces dobzhanskii CBS 2104]|uniref:WGS project CCBQ000000000 data, contig 00099 n=1 Tax=Kluyveromyces dobzhanskii CBS 2104 TaxID=1427455 RepID=A0A0A8L4F0_9SACH|nr:unnamed protein product [Kluyveromyces dobzhanskii CBS 2104]
MSLAFALSPCGIALRLLAHRRHIHHSVTLLNGLQENQKKDDIPANSPEQHDEEEVIFFSQDKDILPEVEIKPFKRIRSETSLRYNSRVIPPSVDWYSKTGETVEGGSANLTNLLGSDTSSSALFQETLKWLSKDNFKLKNIGPNGYNAQDIEFYFHPSAVLSSTLMPGDICVLKSSPYELLVCVKTPSDAMDARFAFANADGAIVYAWKSSVQLRFPSIFKTTELDLIQREKKHRYMPVGSVKNEKDVTFIIPTLPRRMLVSNVTFRITDAAVQQLPLIKKKLELIHRYSQLGSSSWQIPMLKLVELCSNLELSSNIERSVATAMKKSGLSSDSLYSLAASHFELSSKVPSKVECSQFLAVYWAILHQQGTQMWGEMTVHKGIFFPSAVTVLPLTKQHLHYHSIIHKLRQNGGVRLDRIAELINAKELVSLNKSFPYLVPLLRDYAAGNVKYNDTITSLISSLFRKLDDYKKFNITRDVCFNLLKRINPSEPHNPLLNNHELQLPINNERVQLEQTIFDLAIPPKNAADITNRTEYKNLVCYCIDSIDAHEIDDAVSIEVLGNSKYRIYIHVADPASLFAEASDSSIAVHTPILDIAYQRAFTTYLPDKVFPMLPVTYARHSDLGQFGKATKAVTFSIDCSLSKTKGLSLLNDTLKIELSTLYKSKRTTYETVDKILENESSTTNKEEFEDLQILFSIARALRKQRVVERGAVVFENDSTGLVSLSSDDNSGSTNISFKNQLETKSTILVSELMILANSLAATFFKKNRIPGIYRGYRPLNLVDDAAAVPEWIQMKTNKNEMFAKADIAKMKAFLTSSFYSSIPTPHEMIGSSQYLTVTSPLRRFPDLVNHLQLHRVLKGLPLLYNQSDLNGMAWHILTRDVTLKNASVEAQRYWTLKFLKEEIETSATKNNWKLQITSLTDNGYAHCVILDMSFAVGQLKVGSYQKPLLVGDQISECQISDIECLDGILRFEPTRSSRIQRKTK